MVKAAPGKSPATKAVTSSNKLQTTLSTFFSSPTKKVEKLEHQTSPQKEKPSVEKQTCLVDDKPKDSELTHSSTSISRKRRLFDEDDQDFQMDKSSSEHVQQVNDCE